MAAPTSISRLTAQYTCETSSQAQPITIYSIDLSTPSTTSITEQMKVLSASLLDMQNQTNSFLTEEMRKLEGKDVVEDNDNGENEEEDSGDDSAEDTRHESLNGGEKRRKL
ncbi:uncharacterized protein SPPG_02287 [Spizellomyces punctatus DAOM BR117]|uniref:EKC/KEOPS complex subunit GON7 n=1 Tax=Spizellomyces punctatus (strain DAOM BR117) TaxID=645134 RepID=A0A0L0HQ99_SPIPD|nr:uncharacterized protein SPPG_02287 [Spizellomyces punctatus DAOM BR117]KND03233.1 hypothetical protein SPPG_02287 [Spizellomyces punctatus DAOM BR117]|eukprot:XP_016611272.1 hypothetical protein SPPG_02287 [Spizellomyces punctatus DAOM BR117]